MRAFCRGIFRFNLLQETPPQPQIKRLWYRTELFYAHRPFPSLLLLSPSLPLSPPASVSLLVLVVGLFLCCCFVLFYFVLFLRACCALPRPKGVVEYVSRDDMKNAIRTLDDTRLGGKYIRVREVSERQTDAPQKRPPSLFSTRTLFMPLEKAGYYSYLLSCCFIVQLGSTTAMCF